MFRFPALFFFLFLCFLTTFGQHQQREDVLRMSNHWVLRGKIIVRTDSSVQIRTRDGNIFSFPAGQIESITEEPVWALGDQRPSHWMNYTELGPLVAGKTTVDGVTTAAFSFQTLMGYQLGCTLMPGIGAGADLYATQTVVPFFATLRGDLLRKANWTLYAFGDGGYGWNITQRTAAGTTYGGGLLYAAGLGIRIPFNGQAGFLLSLGYRYQKTDVNVDGGSSPVIYRRLALRAGFYL